MIRLEATAGCPVALAPGPDNVLRAQCRALGLIKGSPATQHRGISAPTGWYKVPIE